MDTYHVDTLEVETLCKILAKDIHAEFDIILAISRGGLVPAGYLAHMLGIKNVQTICVESYTDDHGQGELKLISGPNPFFLGLQGENILVVDDILDTGKTYAYVRKQIKGVTGDMVNMQLAVLYDKGAAPYPDYWAATIEPDVWVTFPWEVI